jgi:xylulokinase
MYQFAMAPHALGFDVGLSGVRASVVRADGTPVAGARRAHERARLGPGLAEHDPADWLNGIEAAGRAALAQAGDVEIACLGVAALGPAPVLVDAALEPLTSAPLFGLDRRAAATLGAVLPNLGGPPADEALDNPVPSLLRMLDEQPGLAREAALALDATGFVVAALTGVPVMDTVTAADYELDGVEPPVAMPEPIDPTAVAGGLLEGWARRLGLPAGIPVSAGTYDSFVDIAAAGVRRPGDAGLVLGSTMIVCRATQPGTPPPPGLGASRYPGEGELLGGWTLCGGLSLDWFAERFAPGGSRAELERDAAGVDPGRVLALPYLAGERTPLWDPNARGAFTGIGLETGAAELYRALVESLALAVLDHAERLEQVLGPCPAWRVTGGGARNRLWLEATAGALGVPLDVVAGAGEAVGPALLALRAVGIDPERPVEERVEPGRDALARLEGLLPAFRELQGALA